MTDRLTPMEAEVLEMPAKQRGTSAVKDSYGTATPPKPKKSYLGLWILLGLTVVIMSTFGVITHFLRPGGGHTREDGAEMQAQNRAHLSDALEESSQTDRIWQGGYRPALRVSGTSGEEEPLSPAEIYEGTAPSVVCVTMSSLYYSWNCSGIILSQDGFILCATDISPEYATELEVTLHDGSEYTAEWVAMDAATNICVLKIDARGLTAASFSLENSVQVGETVYCIGSPYGPEVNNMLTQGLLSLKRAAPSIGEDCILLQSSAGTEAGYGAPLLDCHGCVVGMITAVGPVLVDTEYDPCFALGSTYLQSVLDWVFSQQ